MEAQPLSPRAKREARRKRREERPIELKVDASGSTGATAWSASNVFAAVLQERLGTSSKQTILELGCGTGYLAMLLARTIEGTRVIATDVPERMRLLKFNVNRNQLRHAVRATQTRTQSNTDRVERLHSRGHRPHARARSREHRPRPHARGMSPA